MKAFRAMALNTVRASLRNRVALFFTLGLAFLFMVIFGLLFSGTGGSISIGVVDHDRTPLSQGYVQALGDHGLSTEIGDETTEADHLQHNNITAYVVIPRGFAAAVQRQASARASIGLVQASNTAQSVQIADSVISQVTAGFAQQSGASTISVAQPTIASANEISAIDYFLPAMIAYIILQSGINYVAIGLAEMRARKVLRRLRATPIRPAQILAAQVSGGALTVLLQLVVLIIAGLLLFHARMYGSWVVLLAPILLGTAAFVGIGFLLTSSARTSESARGLAALVAFPMMFLSGIFFPVDRLPSSLQQLVRILPLTWLSDALHQVMNDNAGIGAIAADCGVLAAWAVATLALATWRFRWD